MKRICLLLLLFALTFSVVARTKVYVECQVLIMNQTTAKYEKETTDLVNNLVVQNLKKLDRFDIVEKPEDAARIIFFCYMEGPFSENPVYSVQVQNKLTMGYFNGIGLFKFSESQKIHLLSLSNDYLLGDNQYSTLLGSCCKTKLNEGITKITGYVKYFFEH